jgi:hypothetical protein
MSHNGTGQSVSESVFMYFQGHLGHVMCYAQHLYLLLLLPFPGLMMALSMTFFVAIKLDLFIN